MELYDAYQQARDDLLSCRNNAGHWEGKLASSALATATAVSALSMYLQLPAMESGQKSDLIVQGLDWILRRQNVDGGWGDTDRSQSNISTTMLVEAALNLAARVRSDIPGNDRRVLEQAQAYIRTQGGVDGLRNRYGKDRTFAVPILTNCALAELVPWVEVPPLPFELACLPQSFYRFVQLPVVSYAIPALVAVGQVIHKNRGTRNPILRVIRDRAISPSLSVLDRMQPDSGGFLEAIPLTSFVAMSLIGAGHRDHRVVQRCIRFLLDTVRDDGSWPIDTNLATWNTTLAVNALSQADDLEAVSCECREWITSCQHTQRHPYTGADPGGWAWSDLSGAVPDADDTPGALLALHALHTTATSSPPDAVLSAVESGVTWLLDLQNRDGGWPTFCRGWGTLPFDRSGSDLTAHAIRALAVWRQVLPNPLPQRVVSAVSKGFGYLKAQQRPDGSWIPLWFGNQQHSEEENPVYGTAKVLLAYRDTGRIRDEVSRKAMDWLISNQQEDGGWHSGLGSTSANAEVTARQTVDTMDQQAFSIVEETALAVEALLADNSGPGQQAARRGLDWLVEAVQQGRHLDASPIGFYFAKLWYYEDLYPVLFTVSALGAAVRAKQMTTPVA